MAAKVFLFRCPPDLAQALTARAESDGLPVGQVIRAAVGRYLGLGVKAAPMQRGLAGADAETVRRVSSLGGQAEKKRPAEKKSAKRNTISTKHLGANRKKPRKKAG